MMSRRVKLAVALGLTIAIGLASRFYMTPSPGMVQKELGDVLWAMAAYFAIAMCFPAMRGGRVAIVAGLLACLSEASQLSKAPLLEWGRQFRTGRLLLGTGFSWLDMAMYPIGAVAAWCVDRSFFLLRRRSTPDVAKE